LYWLINSATSVQRATFVKLLREMKGEDPQSLPTPNSPASSPAPQLHFNAKHSPSHLPTSDHAANNMAHGADGPEIDVSVHSCNTTHSGWTRAFFVRLTSDHGKAAENLGTDGVHFNESVALPLEHKLRIHHTHDPCR
jgi:hypothetical protein